jgi:membrane associated rhomboid family serine protease
MPDLSQLWLQMLLISVAIGLLSRLRQGWRWAAGGVAQLAIIAAIAAYGLLVGSAATCAWLSWGLLLLVSLWPRVLLRRLQYHVGVLDTASAREEAARLQLFVWGRPGRYWRDFVESTALELDGQPREAEALMIPYMSSKVPKGYRDAARGNVQALRTLQRDWPALVAEFETYTLDDGSRLPLGQAAAAARAYLELGELRKARQTIERIDFAAERASVQSLAMFQVPFEALAGDLAGTDAALDEAGLPEHMRLQWQARALAANDRIEEARAIRARALQEVPEDQPHVARRIRELELEVAPRLGLDPATPAELAALREVFARARHAGAMLEPTGWSPAVVGLLTLIGLAFAPAHLYSVWPTERALDLAGWVQSHGELTTRALHGEPWRLLSYQLLHADGMHVLLNLIILAMFGRQATQIFGSVGFLVAFVLSGIAGGLAQIWLLPDSHTIGASGAVLGIFGMVIAGLWRSRSSLPDAVWRERLSRLLAIAALQMALDQLFANQVAVLVHGAGLLAGCVAGLAWPPRRKG